MDRIISNATPLIYLAKAGRLDLLFQIFQETLIPKAVYDEVVLKGKAQGQKDAFILEKAISEGRISVHPVKSLHPAPIAVHYGEVEVISLALEKDIRTVLIDDAKGRMAAEMSGLDPKGTIWLLLASVKKKVLSFDDFLEALEDITKSGFYLHENLYITIIREARRLGFEQA